MDGPAGEDEAAAAAPAAASEPGIIEVLAEDFAFTAPPTFPSGWVTLRFRNEGAEPHFLMIQDLPDGKTFDDYYREVSQPFEAYYTRYRSGELDQAAFFDALVGALPEWFYDTVTAGGPGFTAPGETSEVTIHLAPGDNYVMECYVRTKDDDDTFHGTRGMLRPLIVTEADSGLQAPSADVEIVLSSFDIAVTGDFSAGPQTVKVTVADTPEGFILHNVHLARLEDGQTAQSAAEWLDWVDAMVAPAPAHFLGGAGQTVAGRESYLTIDLEPGRYAWVSEGFAAQGMVREFTVQ